jgi:hypothetical protein
MRHSIQNPEADRLRPLRPARAEHPPTPLIRIKASTSIFRLLDIGPFGGASGGRSIFVITARRRDRRTP